MTLYARLALISFLGIFTGTVFLAGYGAGRAYTEHEMRELFYAQGRVAQLEIRIAQEERARIALHVATQQGFQWVDGVFQMLFGPPKPKQQAGL
jgi:hypothetical protein